MIAWGDYYAGECVHRDSPLRCPVCRAAERSAWAEAVPLLVAVLTVAGFLLLGSHALDQEGAADREQLRQHLQRLDAHQPGAAARLREMAADQRQKD